MQQFTLGGQPRKLGETEQKEIELPFASENIKMREFNIKSSDGQSFSGLQDGGSQPTHPKSMGNNTFAQTF